MRPVGRSRNHTRTACAFGRASQRAVSARDSRAARVVDPPAGPLRLRGALRLEGAPAASSSAQGSAVGRGLPRAGDTQIARAV